MRDKEECCGTCRYHKPDGTFPDDWVCTNPDSDNYSEWTEYEDTCDEWESRKGKR